MEFSASFIVTSSGFRCVVAAVVVYEPQGMFFAVVFGEYFNAQTTRDALVLLVLLRLGHQSRSHTCTLSIYIDDHLHLTLLRLDF